MSQNEIIDKASAELVEEILSCPEGVAWFFVVRAKMEALVKDIKARRKK
jgi:hypothetical protein